MAIFYFIFVSIDWMLIAIGNSLFDDDTSYKCLHNVYLIVNDPIGALYLTFHAIFVFMFSVLIWYLFYRIPEKYGLIKRMQTEDLKVKSFYARRETPN